MKPLFIFVFLMSAVAAEASGNPGYSHEPSSQVAGGRVTSGNYTIDAAIVSGAEAEAEDSLARIGFAAMLTDPASLSLSPAPAFVNEGETITFTSRLVMDDSTWTPLPAEEIFWGVFSGPLQATTHGSFAADIIYQEAQGEIAATYQTFDAVAPVIVRNNNIDNFPGYSGDGMDDAWQAQHFGLYNPLAAPFLDPDGDGYDNRFEYHAGLIPVDPLSTFHLRIRPHPVEEGQYQILFSPVLPGRTYTVLRNPALSSNTWNKLSDFLMEDQGSERIVTDIEPLSGRGFYQVDVVKD